MKNLVIFCLLTAFLLSMTACAPAPLKNFDSSERTEDDRELTIGVFGINNFEEYASRFNRQAEQEFTVRLIDYQYTGDGTRETAIARLNAELAAGKGPDLIDFDTVPSRDIYARHGLLRDMSDYFYSEFQLDDFYMLDKLNGAGSLYFLPTHFNIITAFGHPDLFGEVNSWSLADYQRLQSLPQFADTPADTKESFMAKLQTSLIPRWIDLEQGVCRFADESFIDALRFAGTLDDTPYASNASPEELVAEGSLLYSEAWIDSPYEICKIERALGGPAAYIGYPTVDGCLGNYMFAYGLCGVNAATKKADYAWKFIRFLLVEDPLIYDKAWIGIPVLKTAVRQKVDGMLHPYAEYEGKTITVNADGTFEVDGVHQDMTYDPTPYITEGQAERFYGLISRCERVYEFDPTVYGLLTNAARRYFSGQCSAEDAGAELQDRVSIYLSEQYG